MGTALLVKKPYVFFVNTTIFLTLIFPAFAHSWYDPVCCDNRDCQEYTGTVVEGPTGYTLENGMVIPYASAKVSQDENFHICIYHGQYRCFYAPPRTF